MSLPRAPRGQSHSTQAFPSFCTVCDNQIPLSSTQQIYCSDDCRSKDSSATNTHRSSLPLRWYDSFNELDAELMFGVDGDATSPVLVSRSKRWSHLLASAKGSPVLGGDETFGDFSLALPEADRHRRRLSVATSASLSPNLDTDSDGRFSPFVGDDHTDASSVSSASLSRPRRHSLYIRSGMQLYTSSSRRLSTGPDSAELAASPRSLLLVLPPKPVAKPPLELEYEFPRLQS